MQQQQRFILFIVLSMALFFVWVSWGPKFFPGLFPQPRQQKPAAAKTAKRTGQKTAGQKTAPPLGKTGKSGVLSKKGPAAKTGAGTKTGVSSPTGGKSRPTEARKPPASPKDKTPKNKTGKTPQTGKKPKKPPAKKQPVPPAKANPALLPRHPGNPVVLGSLDPSTGFFLQVELTPRGAAVNFIRLNDERYRSVENRNEQLKVVGSTGNRLKTMRTAVPVLDKLFREKFGATVSEVNWAVSEKKKVNGVLSSVTFSLTSPDGTLRVSKQYSLVPVDLKQKKLKEAQDTESAGYELRLNIRLENLSNQPQEVEYRLQGPVGLPLENIQYSRVFRNVVTGFWDEEGEVVSESIPAAKVVETPDEWRKPIRYIGVDVQYFAALLVPMEDQRRTPYVRVTKTVVAEKAANPKHSDVSVELYSQPLKLAPHGAEGFAVTHKYVLYAGPKRKQLLEAYQAEEIIQYGWFGVIARGMLWLLNLFHRIGLPYGLAIILLTFVVRGAMFPLSRKQALSARKMKELQPKIAELKQKYGDDREKLARAQMELFAKHGYNPLAGCLPIFLQLPIFIGLYQALRNAVELRLAPFPFTWIDNLAAPDALFPLPFRVPLVGWTTFNLLPIITVVLFVFQQKMFMPPPTDEQQAMQQKMMSWMSIFFGFLFYTVPSGLCIYFIASSLWGMAERKLLDQKAQSAPAETEPASAGRGTAGTQAAAEKPQGFFGKLLKMADEAAEAKARGNGTTRSSPEKTKAVAHPGSSQSRKKGRKNRKPKR